MLEHENTAVIFYAHYVASKLSKTGLTVTVDVWEVQRDGTATEIVTGGSATEIGDGLYRYLLAAGSVDEPAEYIAVFKTADTSVDQRHIPAIWVIDRAGVENLDASIAGLNDLSAAEVWAYAQRTLTQTLASITAALTGDEITITRGDRLVLSVTDLGDITGYKDVWFSVKFRLRDSEDDAILRVSQTAGLERVQKAAPTAAGNGSLTVDDATDGDITVIVEAVETAKLEPATDIHYDVQWLDASDHIYTLSLGVEKATIQGDVTRATS